jgi:hypothetical protein
MEACTSLFSTKTVVQSEGATRQGKMANDGKISASEFHGEWVHETGTKGKQRLKS